MFSDKQLGRPVIELLAGLLADFDARRPATWADLFGFLHIMLDAIAAKILGQCAS